LAVDVEIREWIGLFMGMDSRQAALNTLIAYRRDGAWSEAYLKKLVRANEMSKRDASLAANICYGVLQNSILLDFYIDAFSNVKKIDPKVRDILRIGAYQIIFLDRIPISAAVNEAVKIAKKDNPKAAGFINAILRKLSAEKDSLPIPQGDEKYRLSILTSHPEWLVGKYLKIFGESTKEMLEANNKIPEITARVNSALCDVQLVINELEKQGVQAATHAWLPNCVVMKNTGDIEELFAYKKGLITVQDVASQIAGMAAGTRPGERVLDACAAPGGKSFVLAQEMENSGELWACDIHPHKVDIIRRGAERLKLSCVHTKLQNAAEYYAPWEKYFDVVLADVPCSGLGIIRKKPDIRYKKPDEIKALPQIQLEILKNVSKYVKPGGALVYSTCTVVPQENEKNVEAFIKENPEFKKEEFYIPGSNEKVFGDITLLPITHGTDGFYICRMRRDR